MPNRVGGSDAFLNALGNPQREYPTLHVAGTSGKGSTSTMLAAVLQASGPVPAGGVKLSVPATTNGLGVGSNTGSVTVSFAGTPSAQGRIAPTDGGSTSTSSNISVNLVAPVANTPKNTPPPDALIIATGIVHHTKHLVTNDAQWSQKLARLHAQIRVLNLSDFT